MPGPLAGYKIVELAGIGPGPFAAMLLADMGADVIRIDRAQAVRPIEATTPRLDVTARNRRSIGLDLKNPEAIETALALIETADGLIEGFRPGVMERLGLGPDVCQERNPRLVYGRMTGWGQTGPYAHAAGHDINYISLAGALAHFGRRGEGPVPPLNMVGDFGGGGMFLAFGLVCGILEAQRSGAGQVVDAAMVDGTAVLMTMFWTFKNTGLFDENARGTNMLDTGAHYYDVYRCSDDQYISIGSIESQFYAELLRLLDLTDDAEFARQNDKTMWPHLKDRLSAIFATKTRDEWCATFEHTDVCFAPVLTMSEAAQHPHNVEREMFVEANGLLQPAPAPRFSRTAGEIAKPSCLAGEHTAEVLSEIGLSSDRIAALMSSGAAR